MNNTKAYKALLLNYSKISQLKLLDLFKDNPNRGLEFNLSLDGLYFDFSKNNVTTEILNQLAELAKEQSVTSQIEAMFSGKKINSTEDRAVLHIALRADPQQNIYVGNKNVMPDITNVLLRMQKLSNNLHNGKHLGYTDKQITDIVNIGIGGSDLGPVLVCQALKPYRQANGNSTNSAPLNIHFVSSVDGYQIHDVLSDLNPETTLFVIASKTFTTIETMTNAETAKEWFLGNAKDILHVKKHFVAVSTNINLATKFGIDVNNIFEFWDFVGGRYSLWSAIGLSIILYIGYDNFIELLSGARAMDRHFYNNRHNLLSNMPVVLALISIWYRNFYNYSTQVISPYNTCLTRLPAYIQQLEMESNGKSVTKNGELITEYQTCPVIWGDAGINGQHAYYQLLHQGTSINPMDIIIAMSSVGSNTKHNDILVASAFAQAEAFMCGKNYEVVKEELLNLGMSESEAIILAKHKTFTGNRPTNMIVLPEITPYYLGMLIALYEHKAFVQGTIWGINSFDQMGVELGKHLAINILEDIKSQQQLNPNRNLLKHDSSTNKLIEEYIKYKNRDH